jgi:hypothetical protein
MNVRLAQPTPTECNRCSRWRGEAKARDWQLRFGRLVAGCNAGRCTQRQGRGLAIAACVLGASYLAAHSMAGWGWLLLLAFFL